jgi:ATP-dependent Clp protease protease subunit
MHSLNNEKSSVTESDLIAAKVFESRTVLIFGEISDTVAREVTQQLVTLDTASSEPITVLVSSPGGHVESGDAIHDVVRFIRSPVRMIGTGWVGSAAAHLFLAAPSENRVCLPNTRFLIHQPSGGIGGKGTDIAIQAREILLTRQRIANATGHSLEKVMLDIERDHWLSATEAINYGLISRIIEHRSELENDKG